MKKKLLILGIMLLFMVLFTGCGEETKGKSGEDSIILATTTSTENSGLLDSILPHFEEDTGIKVKVVAVGTGKALQMGKDGEADVLLVHAKSSEEEFIREGHGTKRYDVMYNDFILVGPSKEQDKGLVENSNNIVDALKVLKENQYRFISRGDDSGTHKKEKSLWDEASIEPEGDWYISAGKGMGDVLQMTHEMLAYTLTDRATYLSMKDNLDLGIIVEGDSRLFNQYGVIPVNPDKNSKINDEGAAVFVKWLISSETQKLIGEFGNGEYGQALFLPNGDN